MFGFAKGWRGRIGRSQLLLRRCGRELGTAYAVTNGKKIISRGPYIALRY